MSSKVDFRQEARDQGCLHVALESVGETSGALLRAVGKVLRDMPPFQLPEPKDTVLFLRFIDGGELPCWAGSTKWGDYSAHKNVLGLLCVAQCHDSDDLDNIRAGYRESRHKALKRGLCDSRCLVYGPKKSCMDLKDGMVHIDATVDELDILAEDTRPAAVEKVAGDLAQAIYNALKPQTEKVYKEVLDPARTEPIRHLKAPMEVEVEMEDVEQR